MKSTPNQKRKSIILCRGPTASPPNNNKEAIENAGR